MPYDNCSCGVCVLCICDAYEKKIATKKAMEKGTKMNKYQKIRKHIAECVECRELAERYDRLAVEGREDGTWTETKILEHIKSLEKAAADLEALRAKLTATDPAESEDSLTPFFDMNDGFYEVEDVQEFVGDLQQAFDKAVHLKRSLRLAREELARTEDEYRAAVENYRKLKTRFVEITLDDFDE